MKRLALLGASGHGKVVADAALQAGWDSVVFFDQRWPALAAVEQWPVSGGMQQLLATAATFDGVAVSIGDNAARMSMQRELESAGAVLASVIHPGAVVSPFAVVGAGCVILSGAVVGPFASLGRGCILNTCASVDHDCEVADGVHVSPGAHIGGGVTVGEASWIGIGASVNHCLSIGARSIVGGGAAVVEDVAADTTVVGVPARPI